MHIFKMLRKYFILFILCFAFYITGISAIGEVIWAVNCGGDAHTDIHGIRYQKDTATTGVASDYGKNLIIQREVPQDQILYQTERYHTETFGYEIPIRQDGDYVLVMKFSEVWFTAPNQKVFDILLNGEHTIVDSLDIFAKVGRGVAHDEIIPFTAKGGELRFMDDVSTVEANRVSVEFVKGDKDNPKINAMYVMRGTVDDVPQLPPLPGFDRPDVIDEEEEEYEEDLSAKNRKKRPSAGPKVQDPYAADDAGSMMLPVVVAIGAFIPLVFCLCKL